MQVLRAKRCCAHLRVTLASTSSRCERDEWVVHGGMHQYAGARSWARAKACRPRTFYASVDIRGVSLVLAFAWVLSIEHRHYKESYAILITTSGGGTHVNRLALEERDVVRELRIPKPRPAAG